MSDLEKLLAELPDDALVPVRWLRSRLRADSSPQAESVADLSAADVAKQLGRKPGTIAGWIRNGRLEGYRLNRREWRVTAASLRAFLDAAQRQRDGGESEAPPDLSSWRRVAR